jgi:hypothetical protein
VETDLYRQFRLTVQSVPSRIITDMEAVIDKYKPFYKMKYLLDINSVPDDNTLYIELYIDTIENTLT